MRRNTPMERQRTRAELLAENGRLRKALQQANGRIDKALDLYATTAESEAIVFAALEDACRTDDRM